MAGNLNGIYNMRAVTQKLGISPAILRAWERRYDIVNPTRSDAGHRLYTEHDVEVLQWLVSMVNQGFTIGRAVELYKQGRGVRKGSENSESKLDLSSDKTGLAEFRERLLKELSRFQDREADRILDDAFAIYDFSVVVFQLMKDVQVEVGDRWEKGELTVAHEHFATSFLRNRLGALFRTMPAISLFPRFVAFCPEGEHHELGLLFFTLYLRKRGFEVTFLGSNLPADQAVPAIKQIRPQIAALSISSKINFDSLQQTVETLRSKFPSLRFAAGGRVLTDERCETLGLQFIGNDEEDWHRFVEDQICRIKTQEESYE